MTRTGERHFTNMRTPGSPLGEANIVIYLHCRIVAMNYDLYPDLQKR